jgi:hypothetical protein
MIQTNRVHKVLHAKARRTALLVPPVVDAHLVTVLVHVTNRLCPLDFPIEFAHLQAYYVRICCFPLRSTPHCMKENAGFLSP